VAVDPDADRQREQEKRQKLDGPQQGEPAGVGAEGGDGQHRHGEGRHLRAEHRHRLPDPQAHEVRGADHPTSL
jgi:hypothetical protein